MTELIPLVSIAIPFYNCESFLEKSIISVINQSYKSWNLLLIDDGSTDNSLSIARKYESDTRIKVISDGLNKGLVTRLNESVELASGKYYARMDADDIMHPLRIEKQVEFLKSRQDIDVLGTSAYTINEKDEIKQIILYEEAPIVDPFHPCFVHPSVIGKTEWFRRNQYSRDFERMEDFELWLRARKTSLYYNLSLPLMYYRESGVPIPKKYLATQKSALKLAFRGKSYNLSVGTRIKYFTQTIIKCLVCIGLEAINKPELQIKLRRRKTKIIDTKEAEKGLKQALSSNFI